MEELKMKFFLSYLSKIGLDNHVMHRKTKTVFHPLNTTKLEGRGGLFRAKRLALRCWKFLEISERQIGVRHTLVSNASYSVMGQNGGYSRGDSKSPCE